MLISIPLTAVCREQAPSAVDLLNCLCKSVCIVGCWTSSLLAKRIPHMHVNNIPDSNSNSKFITLRAHLVLALCYLRWWSFLPPTSALTLVANVVLTLCYLHWWSFSASNYHIYSTATCGGPNVTCTVWWWWWWWWWLLLIALVVFSTSNYRIYSTATCGI